MISSIRTSNYLYKIIDTSGAIKVSNELESAQVIEQFNLNCEFDENPRPYLQRCAETDRDFDPAKSSIYLEGLEKGYAFKGCFKS